MIAAVHRCHNQPSARATVMHGAAEEQDKEEVEEEDGPSWGGISLPGRPRAEGDAARGPVSVVGRSDVPSRVPAKVPVRRTPTPLSYSVNEDGRTVPWKFHAEDNEYRQVDSR